MKSQGSLNSLSSGDYEYLYTIHLVEVEAGWLKVFDLMVALDEKSGGDQSQ